MAFPPAKVHFVHRHSFQSFPRSSVAFSIGDPGWEEAGYGTGFPVVRYRHQRLLSVFDAHPGTPSRIQSHRVSTSSCQSIQVRRAIHHLSLPDDKLGLVKDRRYAVVGRITLQQQNSIIMMKFRGCGMWHCKAVYKDNELVRANKYYSEDRNMGSLPCRRIFCPSRSYRQPPP